MMLHESCLAQSIAMSKEANLPAMPFCHQGSCNVSRIPIINYILESPQKSKDSASWSTYLPGM